MKILIYSDNKWVIESIEKYIDFDYELLENVDLESLNQRIDYIFVDMQVKNVSKTKLNKFFNLN